MAASLLFVVMSGVLTPLVCGVAEPSGDGAACEPVRALAIVYPRDGAVFPPDMAAPTIRWEDVPDAKRWRVHVEFGDGSTPVEVDCAEPRWAVPNVQWALIRAKSLDQDATVTVERVTDDAGAASASVRLRTSREPVGAPIFYRDVPLPISRAISELGQIRWRLGQVSAVETPPAVLEGMPVCANCHSFSADGRTLAMDVDYGSDKGSYAITDIAQEVVLDKSKVISWSDYKREDGVRTLGILSQISPDGRYVVSTVKETMVSVQVLDLYCSQIFFPIKGILVVYDRETQQFAALPGADDPAYVQSNPTWSPDGKWLVFARAKAFDPVDCGVPSGKERERLVSGEVVFRYDLYRIPFNDGQGGTPEPLQGASNNGRSNHFAKYSPDGKWLVFCQSDTLMFNRPTSDLYIMPAEGGEPRRMRCNTADRMDSWHSWSPNGRWLVFSSKAHGPYTQLWLTHIDEGGNDSVPVLLDHFMPPERAANIPEFANIGRNQLTVIHQQLGY